MSSLPESRARACSRARLHGSLLRAGAGAALALLLVAPSVRAAGGVAKWTEWHATGDEVKISVDAAGQARVEHAIRYRVVMGPLRQFDLSGIEHDAVLGPEASITSEDGRELSAHVEAKGEGALHVSVDEPKGLKRGNYTFHVHYDVDLLGAKELVRDGAMWRLSWRSPAMPEGYDGARVVFAVPAAQTEPRPVKTGPLVDGAQAGTAPAEAGEDGVVAVLHRTLDRDELELVRPHVARGEAPLWVARVDPKAFPAVRTPELRPPPPAPPPEPNRVREASCAAGLLALALLFGALVRSKMSYFAAMSADSRALPAPLLPVSPTIAGLIAGAAIAGGAVLQAAQRPTLGAVLVALALLCGVSRTPRAKHAPRGPGRWLALRPEEAFAKEVSRGHVLDIGTRAGKLVAGATCAAIFALIALSRALAPEAPYFVAIDAFALVPLFVTGRRAQLPPDLARAPAPVLARVFATLRRNATLKVAPWARVPLGARKPDELRLLVVPRASLPGLVGIELGVAWMRTATGYAPRAEVLVRAEEASDAAGRLALLAPFARPVPGRRPEERVVRLFPRLPGRAAAAALIVRLARELTDRRVKIGGWDGPERRVVERTDKMPAAA